eukprot:497179-Pelagomonas_calceolata.AAC.3
MAQSVSKDLHMGQCSVRAASWLCLQLGRADSGRKHGLCNYWIAALKLKQACLGASLYGNKPVGKQELEQDSDPGSNLGPMRWKQWSAAHWCASMVSNLKAVVDDWEQVEARGHSCSVTSALWEEVRVFVINFIRITAPRVVSMQQQQQQQEAVKQEQKLQQEQEQQQQQQQQQKAVKQEQQQQQQQQQKAVKQELGFDAYLDAAAMAWIVTSIVPVFFFFSIFLKDSKCIDPNVSASNLMMHTSASPRCKTRQTLKPSYSSFSHKTLHVSLLTSCTIYFT